MKRRCLLIFTITLSACGSDSSGPTDPSQQQIMPLAVGNQWSYREMPVGGYISDTTDYTLTAVKDTIMNLVIDSVTEIGRWYRITGLAGMAPTFYANRSTGFWQTFIHVDSNGTTLVTNLMAKHPTQMGEAYSRPFPPPLSSGSQIVEVISADSSISVPAGTFTCQVYRVYLTMNVRKVYDAFYAPGVGRVKIHHYDLTPLDSSVTRESFLTGFSLQ